MANELMLLSHLVSAGQGRELGFVNIVVPGQAFEARGHGRPAVSRQSPLLMRAIR